MTSTPIKKSYAIKDTGLLFSSTEQGKKYILKIHDLNEEDRPREKLLTLGPASLRTSELLAIVLQTGTKKEGVLEMSNRIIKEYGEKNIMSMTDPQKISAEFDLPLVKACIIVATGELGRRFFKKNEGGLVTLRVAKEVYEYVKDMHDLPREHLRGIYLDSHHRVIHDEMLSIGTINSNIIHPREVFKAALEYNAAAVILVHNHPSGIVEPSSSDIEITEQLIKAGKIMGIHLLDHIIVTKNGFMSVDADY